ncbi:MAG: helix-turn-helix transcriptional regulator [Spirochaetes bacterium]|nr:helix-turn-helix transcriptional regulator [Spirochaetota bacterium]
MAHSVRVLFLSRSNNQVDLSAPAHVHDFHQFLYLFKGSCRATLDGVALEASRGTWITIAPGVRHSLAFPSPEKAACDVFQLKARFDQGWAGRFPVSPLAKVVEHRKRFEGALHELLWARRRPELDLHRAAEGLLGWVALLLSHTPDEQGPRRPEDERLRRVLAWLDQHEGPTPEIRELARQAGLHPSYFTRLFRARTGFSPSEWIIRRRLEYAHSLVVFSSAKLNEIAQLSGYRNYHHFFNQFSRQYGKSPSQIREERDQAS